MLRMLILDIMLIRSFRSTAHGLRRHVLTTNQGEGSVYLAAFSFQDKKHCAIPNKIVIEESTPKLQIKRLRIVYFIIRVEVT